MTPQMTPHEIISKEQELIDAGWHWAADPTTWSGGFFWHEEQGYVTNGGGSFSWIGEAVAAVVRYQAAMAMMQ